MATPRKKPVSMSSYFSKDGLQRVDFVSTGLTELQTMLEEGEAKKKLGELIEMFNNVRRDFDLLYHKFGEELWEKHPDYQRPIFTEYPPMRRVGRRRRKG